MNLDQRFESGQGEDSLVLRGVSRPRRWGVAYTAMSDEVNQMCQTLFAFRLYGHLYRNGLPDKMPSLDQVRNLVSGIKRDAVIMNGVIGSDLEPLADTAVRFTLPRRRKLIAEEMSGLFQAPHLAEEALESPKPQTDRFDISTSYQLVKIHSGVALARHNLRTPLTTLQTVGDLINLRLNGNTINLESVVRNYKIASDALRGLRAIADNNEFLFLDSMNKEMSAGIFLLLDIAMGKLRRSFLGLVEDGGIDDAVRFEPLSRRAAQLKVNLPQPTLEVIMDNFAQNLNRTLRKRMREQPERADPMRLVGKVDYKKGDRIARMVLVDSGAGVTKEIEEHGLHRGVSGQGGQGIALADLNSILKDRGGEITVKNRRDGITGAEVTLMVPVSELK